MIVVMPNGRAAKDMTPRTPFEQAGPGVRGVRERPAEGPHPVRREELLGEGRPREPGAGRAVDGRRAVAELRAEAPRHVRLGRRLRPGPEHQAGRRPDQGRRRAAQEAAAAVAVVRRHGLHPGRQQEVPRRRWRRRRCRTSGTSAPAGTPGRCGRTTCICWPSGCSGTRSEPAVGPGPSPEGAAREVCDSLARASGFDRAGRVHAPPGFTKRASLGCPFVSLSAF